MKLKLTTVYGLIETLHLSHSGSQATNCKHYLRLNGWMVVKPKSMGEMMFVNKIAVVWWQSDVNPVLDLNI